MQIVMEYFPTYELVTSYRVFTDTKLHKMLDLGPSWVKATRKLLPATLSPNSPVPSRLVHQCPHRDDPHQFIAWLAGLPVGELYERLLAIMGDDRADIPADLGAARDQAVAALDAWNEVYFATLDPRIHQGLAADAVAKQGLLESMPPEVVVELATGGLCLEPEATGSVLLVPQYHGRPINLLEGKGPNWAIGYPVDARPPEPGAVPAGLLARTRAVSDPSRLQILRFLAEGARTFTEVVEFAGLAKSTVHHHMVTLRSAGLVRVHMTSGTAADRYSLRLDGAQQVGDRLLAYLKGE